jgi:hypothetical protein
MKNSIMPEPMMSIAPRSWAMLPDGWLRSSWKKTCPKNKIFVKGGRATIYVANHLNNPKRSLSHSIKPFTI